MNRVELYRGRSQAIFYFRRCGLRLRGLTVIRGHGFDATFPFHRRRYRGTFRGRDFNFHRAAILRLGTLNVELRHPLIDVADNLERVDVCFATGLDEHRLPDAAGRGVPPPLLANGLLVLAAVIGIGYGFSCLLDMVQNWAAINACVSHMIQ